MGIIKFIIAFIISLVGIIFLNDFITNKFIFAFVTSLIVAVLASMD